MSSSCPTCGSRIGFGAITPFGDRSAPATDGRAIRTAREALLDSLTGPLAELRDMARDNHFARQILDSYCHHNADNREQALAQFLVIVLRENAAYQKHALRLLECSPGVTILPTQGEK